MPPRTEESIFHEALQQPTPDARAAFLDAACAGDAILRARLAGLLASHEQAGSFLRKPGAQTTEDSVQRPGTMVGPYKLLQQIGEGGMGVVYMAEQQQPVRRLVALKIIKPGMDSGQVIARFEQERQALAMMDHPNIAKVLDAGTTPDGRPYFVMELVKGIPVTRYCDENQLTPRERLELFVPVCQAVQHAHQKGVIHRDLKPSNVLVASFDDHPVPKVIDFGVAKATGEKLTERTLFTGFGAFVGTLEYMSPEQAKLNALDVDTRSDVYSLGVLLYELLTGTTPLERTRLEKSALDELLRVIREEEPPPPSTRLSQSGEALAGISAKRRMEPATLGRALRGEVDWIVMRALEKDRSRRYDTAVGLARDLQRYLNDEPVEACPPSLGYRLRKAARKHKRALVTVGMLLALMLIGTVVSAWLAARAREAERVARAAEAEAAEQRDLAVMQGEAARDSAMMARRQRDVAAAARQELRQALYASRAAQVQTAWEANHTSRVLDLLNQQRPKPGEPDLRGFEWHYFDRLCHAELRTLKLTDSIHGSPVFSPDATRLAGVVLARRGKPASVKVWTLADGKELYSRPVSTPPHVRLAFSPDGNRLALSLEADYSPVRPEVLWERIGEGQLIAVDLATGKDVFTLKGAFGRPVAFSPDGRRVATAVRGREPNRRSEREQVKAWDVASGKEVLALPEQPGAVADLAFSPDGGRIAVAHTTRSASSNSELRTWDAEKGAPRGPVQRPGFGIRCVRFSPDGLLLAASGMRLEKTKGPTGGVSVFDGDATKEVVAIANPDGGVAGFAFSPDGRRLAGFALDNAGLRLWDAATGRELSHARKGRIQAAMGIAFSPDGKRYLSVGGSTVRTWDATPASDSEADGVPRWVAMPGPRGATEAVFFPAVQDQPFRPEVVLRDSTGQELSRFAGHEVPVRALWFSPDGSRIASWDEAGELKVWDVATGTVRLALKRWRPFLQAVKRLPPPLAPRFSANGRLLAAWAPEGGIKVWDLDDGKERFACKDKLLDWEFSPTGARIVTVSRSAKAEKFELRGELKAWDLSTGKLLFSRVGPFQSLAFSQDGTRLAVATTRGEVTVWDAVAGAEVLELPAKVAAGGGLALNHDGTLLAAAAAPAAIVAAGQLASREVVAWEIPSGKERYRLKGHGGPLTGLVFTPDGKRIASASLVSLIRRGEVKLWDAATGAELLTLKPASDVTQSRWLSVSADGARLTVEHDFLQRAVTPEVFDATPRTQRDQ